MLRRFIARYSGKFLSRWLVLLFDAGLVVFAYAIAVLLRTNFDFNVFYEVRVWEQLALTLPVYLLFFWLSKSYTGIIRHTGLHDAELLAQAVGLSGLFLAGIGTAGRTFGWDYLEDFSLSTAIIHVMLSLVALIGLRFLVRSLYWNLFDRQKVGRKRTLIYGAGQSGLITLQSIRSDRKGELEVVGFVDDNPGLQGKTIQGLNVFSPAQVYDTNLVQRMNVKTIIFAIQNMDPEKRADMADAMMEKGLDVKVVPPISQWVNGQLRTGQIQNIRIEDLLERDTIRLDRTHIIREFHEKVILVTGAAGSIGSELVRQLIILQPRTLVLLDQNESGLYDLQQELYRKHPNLQSVLEVVVADVTHEARLRKLLESFKPYAIFHAAAYKHVPLMEAHPAEAIRVNVGGSSQLMDLAVANGVERFVMVSTDKAVNPTNVMGATKRAAELYALALQGTGKTRFTITRFGNVLGSNGSVIPLFRRQIEQGGPVTVTHPDIIRFFMTIPEACNLVLEAGAMGTGGEVYVFDMGKPVKIVDLARKMIKLSGFEPGRDIQIQFSGLRPGEKLYEELLANREQNQPTHHPKILIANSAMADPEMVRYLVKDLCLALPEANNFQLVKKLKRLMPEYVSQNSIFSSLDAS
jgi:FlaA1/EpsC-like NDP-sugar epimerase